MELKRSHRVLQALEEAEHAQTVSELAATIDDLDHVKNVAALLYNLQYAGRVVKAGQRDNCFTWNITESGRQFLTDVLAEQQDCGIGGNGAARRVMAAERQRHDADGPPVPPPMPDALAIAWNPANGITPATAAVCNAVFNGEPSIAVREDGALVVLEADRIVYTLSPEFALRIAAVVRRLRAAE